MTFQRSRKTQHVVTPNSRHTWRVVLKPQTAIDIVAYTATVFGQGMLIFRDPEGELIKSFAVGTWLSAEMVNDPYGNEVLGEVEDGDAPTLHSVESHERSA